MSANDTGATPLDTTPQDLVFQVYGLNDGTTGGLACLETTGRRM